MNRSFPLNPAIDDLLRHGQVEDACAQPLVATGTDRLTSFLSGASAQESTAGETALYASLTLGDLLYDYIRIDPTVVSGIDFARSEDLHSVFSLSEFASRQLELDPEQLSGSLSQMQGYVAERLVALHLVAQGHDVVFLELSNQEGWDILVDGERFQVKCYRGTSGVYEHLHRFPDIPVIVNADLADSVGDHHNVYVDPLLHHDQVVQMTQDTLHHARDLGDLQIPWISLAVSSVYAARDLAAGHTTVDAAMINVVSNTAGRIVFGKLGSVSAGMAGLLLFGPAGKLLFTGAGAIGGAYAGRRIAGMLRKGFLTDADQQVRATAKSVAERAVEALDRKLLVWREKQGLVHEAFTDSGSDNATGIRGMVLSRMDTDFSYFTNKRRELEAVCLSAGDVDQQQLWIRLLALVRRAGLHPHAVQDELTKLYEALAAYGSERRKYVV